MTTEPRSISVPAWVSVGLGVVGMTVAVVLLILDESALDALGAISFGYVALVLPAQLLNVTTDSVRYRMILPGRFRAAVAAWVWHRIYSIGRLLNVVLPQAGSAYRAAQLKLGHGVPISAYLGTVAAATWLGNGLALVLSGVVVVVAGSVAVGAAMVGIGLVITLLVGVLPRFPFWRRGQQRLPQPVARVLEGLGESFRELASVPGRLWRVTAISLLSQASGAFAFVLVSAALDLESPIEVGFVLYAATTLSTVVSLTPWGLGISELAAAFAGGLLSLGTGVGVSVVLVIRATGIVGTGLFALAAMVLARETEQPITPPSDVSR